MLELEHDGKKKMQSFLKYNFEMYHCPCYFRPYDSLNAF